MEIIDFIVKPICVACGLLLFAKPEMFDPVTIRLVGFGFAVSILNGMLA